MAGSDVEFFCNQGQGQVFLVMRVHPGKDFRKILAHGVGAFVKVSGVSFPAHKNDYLAQKCPGQNLKILLLKRDFLFHSLKKALHFCHGLIAKLNEWLKPGENRMNVIDEIF